VAIIRNLIIITPTSIDYYQVQYYLQYLTAVCCWHSQPVANNKLLLASRLLVLSLCTFNERQRTYSDVTNNYLIIKKIEN